MAVRRAADMLRYIKKTDADPRVSVSFDQKKESLRDTKDSTDNAVRPSFQ